MAAGSVIIDLLMKTGAFQTDTERASKALKKLQKDAEQVGKTIGTAIGVGVVAAAVAFDQLVKSAADFKDLEESIGSSAEDIASLSIAAATAGVSMDSVAAATIKLTKGLTGVDDESKAVGAALGALGLNVEEFKRLDPVAQYEAAGKALAGYADGAQKTAVAVALFGKGGAEQLKVFKALEEQGGRQVILTQKQIELADAYADSQARQIATFKVYAQVAATDMLPAFNDLTETVVELLKAFTGIDDAGKKLAGQNQAAEFAKTAVDALAFVVDSGQGVVRIFQAVGKAIGGAFALNERVLNGDLKGARAVAEAVREDIDNILSAELFSQKLAKIREKNQFLGLGQDKTELARRGRGPAALPQLQFDGAEKADKTKNKASDADRYLEKLREQVQKTEDLSKIEELLADIQAGKFKNAKAGQIAEAVRLADQIDGAKQQQEENKKLIEQADELEKASDRLREAGRRVFEDTRTPAEEYAAELERLNFLLDEGAIKHDTYQRAVKQLQERLDENVRKQKELKDAIESSLTTEFATAFEGFITGSTSAKDAFKSFANSVIADMARILSQKLAQDLFSNNAQGILGAIGSLFGGGNTGTSGGGGFASPSGTAPLATGTNYIPYDGFQATLHKGESVVPAKYNPAAGGGMRQKIEVINPPGMPMTAQTREEETPDGGRTLKLLLSAVAADITSGGQIATAQEKRYGQRPNLARRGR